MAETPNMMQGMNINQFYKYILYLAGVILTLSLFWEVKGIDLDYIRKASFTFIVVGIIIWICDKIRESIFNYYASMEEREEIDEYKAKNIFVALEVIWYILIVTLLGIGFFIAFG